MSQNISKFSPSETDPWSWIQPCMRDESSPSQTPFLSQQLSETRSATAILRCWNCSQRTWFSCYWNVFLFDNLKTAPSPKRLQDMGSNSRHGPMLRWTTRKLCFCCCHATPADDALYLGGAWNLLDFPLASNSLWWRQSRQLFLGAQRLSVTGVEDGRAQASPVSAQPCFHRARKTQGLTWVRRQVSPAAFPSTSSLFPSPASQNLP